MTRFPYPCLTSTSCPPGRRGWPIRTKLQVGCTLLFLAVSILAFSCFRGVYSFRSLVRSISQRATEIPHALALAQHVSALSVSLPSRLDNEPRSILPTGQTDHQIQQSFPSLEFDTHLEQVGETLEKYRSQLQDNAAASFPMGNVKAELSTVDQMDATLRRIRTFKGAEGWLLQDSSNRDELRSAVDELVRLAEKLPQHLQQQMYQLQGDVRWHYRVWIVLAWFTTFAALTLMVLIFHLFYRWVFAPLRTLIDGSRRVAKGDFEHRTHLNSGDEMEELANAMNEMTSQFEQVRDDLDRQVQLRTREVIRAEQLASVGFLAAGVAHEINNPLASIALCAESLEERLAELLRPLDHAPTSSSAERRTETGQNVPNESAPCQGELAVVRDYLRMIQDEAFRCKEITERLLDFSRLGDIEHAQTDLAELVQNVVDMVRHVGKYKKKRIVFRPRGPITAHVNPQELKQVVLNLITNGLESLDPGGTVSIDLEQDENDVRLIVTDDGCGMTEEVKANLFQPFFTRRRGREHSHGQSSEQVKGPGWACPARFESLPNTVEKSKSTAKAPVGARG